MKERKRLAMLFLERNEVPNSLFSNRMVWGSPSLPGQPEHLWKWRTRSNGSHCRVVEVEGATRTIGSFPKCPNLETVHTAC